MWGSLWRKLIGRKHEEVEDHRQTAHDILHSAVNDKARYAALYHEQKQVSDKFREEQRRNHFGKMFQTAVPLRDSE